MATTRYKGANSSERLTLSTLSDSDMFQTRHLPGTVNDADKGVSKSLLQALPIAVCATAAATAAKVATLAPESCPDFSLVNGRTVHIYFSAANTASVPTLNLAGTGAIPITYPDGSYVGEWPAGCCLDLMYISIVDGNTAIERWVLVSSLPVNEVTANNMQSVSSDAVSSAMSYSETEQFTGKYWIDGKKIYRKVSVATLNQQVDTTAYKNTGAPLPSNVAKYILIRSTQNTANAFYYSTTNTTLYIAAVTTMNALSGTAYILEYTKTTD